MNQPNVVYQIYEIVRHVSGQESEFVLKRTQLRSASPEDAEEMIVGKFDSGNFTYLPVIVL